MLQIFGISALVLCLNCVFFFLNKNSIKPQMKFEIKIEIITLMFKRTYLLCIETFLCNLVGTLDKSLIKKLCKLN